LEKLMRERFGGARVWDAYVPSDFSSDKRSSYNDGEFHNRGFGFVTFEDPGMLDKVLSRGVTINGWGVELSVARASPRYESRGLNRGEAQEARRRSEGLQELQVIEIYHKHKHAPQTPNLPPLCVAIVDQQGKSWKITVGASPHQHALNRKIDRAS
jgi:hypothetical protein